MNVQLRRGAQVWDSVGHAAQTGFARTLELDGERNRVGLQPVRCTQTRRQGFVWPEDIAKVLDDERKTG